MTQLPSGVYRPGDSIMHGLDATVKLICFFLLLVAVLTTDTPAGYTGMLLFTVSAAYLARLELKRIISGHRRFRWILLLVVLSNFVFYAPEETFGAWWIFTPSYPGLYKGICIALRLAMLLVLSDVITSTTAPLKLSSAFETILSPLSSLKIPVDRFIAVIETATRLLPGLFDDADTIRYAQRARGFSFASKGFFDKAETAQPLILPLIVSSFHKADRLSLVMESRGFGAKASCFSAEKPKAAAGDWAAVLVSAAVCAMQIFIL